MQPSTVLILVAIVVYVFFPLPWIIYRPEGLFYQVDLQQLPWMLGQFALFFTGWIVGTRRVRHFQWQAVEYTHSASSDQRREELIVLLSMAALIVSMLANAYLYSIGALQIDEMSGRPRIPVVTSLASAHIFSLILSISAALHQRTMRPVVFWMAATCALITIALGLLEGRRTAVALPILVLLVIAIVRGNRRAIRWCVALIPLAVTLFLIATWMRTDTEAEYLADASIMEIAVDAVVGRLGNPLLILAPILDDVGSSTRSFDPHTFQSLLSSLPNFSLIDPPFTTGFGNEFGRTMGLLSDTNDFTGINSGWVGEFYMLGGPAAVAIGAAALGYLTLFAWHLVAPNSVAATFLRVMVCVFVVSGFQMEVPFPTVSLLRAMVIACGLVWLEARAVKPPQRERQ